MNRAVLVTVTTRAAGARSSAGSRCAVNAQCPRWSTPSCISKPSTVVRSGIAITPALFTSRSTRSCAARICCAASATTARLPRSSGTTSSEAAGYRSRIRFSAAAVFSGSRAASHDVRAGAGQRERRLVPEPAVRAGHHSRAAGQFRDVALGPGHARRR